LLQIVNLADGDRGLLFVHPRIPVQIDGREPPGYSEELKRAERIGQSVAMPVGALQECRAPVLACWP
jgi:hypothetical protein